MTSKVTNKCKVGPHVFLSASPPSPGLRLLLGGQGLGRSAEQGAGRGGPLKGSSPFFPHQLPSFLPPSYCWAGSQSISKVCSTRSARGVVPTVPSSHTPNRHTHHLHFHPPFFSWQFPSPPSPGGPITTHLLHAHACPGLILVIGR